MVIHLKSRVKKAANTFKFDNITAPNTYCIENRLYWRFFVLLRKEWSIGIYYINNSAIPYSAVTITEVT